MIDFAELNLACKENKLDLIKDLVKQGCDLNICSPRGITVLHLSIIYNQYDLLKWLLENRHELNLDLCPMVDKTISLADFTLKKLKINAKHEASIDLLIDTYTIEARFCDDEDHAAIYDNLIELTQYKYKFSAVDLYTPIQQRNWPLALQLINQKCKIDRPFARGKSPLQALALHLNSNPEAAAVLRAMVRVYSNNIIDYRFQAENKLMYRFGEYLAHSLIIQPYLLPTTADDFEYILFIQRLMQVQVVQLSIYSTKEFLCLYHPNSLAAIKSRLLASVRGLRIHHQLELEKNLGLNSVELKVQLNHLEYILRDTLPWDLENKPLALYKLQRVTKLNCIFLHKYNNNLLYGAMHISLVDKQVQVAGLNREKKMQLSKYKILDFTLLQEWLANNYATILRRQPFEIFPQLAGLELIESIKINQYISPLALCSSNTMQLSLIINAFAAANYAQQRFLSSGVKLDENNSKWLDCKNSDNTIQNLLHFNFIGSFNDFFDICCNILRDNVATRFFKIANTRENRLANISKDIASDTIFKIAHYNFEYTTTFNKHEHGLMLGLSPKQLAKQRVKLQHVPSLALGYQFSQIDNLASYKLYALANGIDMQIVQQEWLRPHHVEAICDFNIFDLELLRTLNAAQVSGLREKKLNLKDLPDKNYNSYNLLTAKTQEQIEELWFGTHHAIVLHKYPSLLNRDSLENLSFANIYALSIMQPKEPLKLLNAELTLEAVLLHKNLEQRNSYIPSSMTDRQMAKLLGLEKIPHKNYTWLYINGFLNDIAENTLADLHPGQLATLLLQMHGKVNVSAKHINVITANCISEQRIEDILLNLPDKQYTVLHAVAAHERNMPIHDLLNLNREQLLGLIFDFTLSQVCSNDFTLDKLCAAIFLDKNPYYLMTLQEHEVTAYIGRSLTDFKIQNLEQLTDHHAPYLTIYQNQKPAINTIIENYSSIYNNDQIVLYKQNIEQHDAYIDPKTDAHDTELLLELCQKHRWTDVRELLENGADIRQEFARGKSPVEYMVYDVEVNREYISFLKFMSVYLKNDYNLSFYLSYGIYSSFVAAIASTQVLSPEYLPLDTDPDEYHYFYNLLQRIQLQIIQHSQFAGTPWYDSVDGVFFKATGSVGAVMHDFWLKSHRKFFAQENYYQFMQYHLLFVTKSELLDSVLNQVYLCLQNYLPWKKTNFARLVQNIDKQQPVAFDIQIMLSMYAHNLNGYICDNRLFIANRMKGPQAISIYLITDMYLFLRNLQKIFGFRCEEAEYLNLFNDNSLKLEHTFALPKQEAFNCTYTSMDALYNCIVLSQISNACKTREEPQDFKAYFDDARLWCNAVLNFGIALIQHELGWTGPSPLKLPTRYFNYDIYNLPVGVFFSSVSSNTNLLHEYSVRYHKVFNSKMHENAALAGIKLPAKHMSSALKNLLYDMGPQFKQDVYSYKDKQIYGLNFGLSNQQVSNKDFEVVNAMPILQYGYETVKKLSKVQILALQNNVPIQIATKPWFDVHHIAAIGDFKITDENLLSRLSLDQIGLAKILVKNGAELQIELIDSPYICDLHLFAAESNKSKYSLQQLLTIPGPQALGLACGLSVEQVYSDNYSRELAKAVYKGIEYNVAVTKSRLQLEFAYAFPKDANLIFSKTDAELDPLMINVLKIEDWLHYKEFHSKAAAAKMVLNRGLNEEIFSLPNFCWIHAVALVLKLTFDEMQNLSTKQIAWKLFANDNGLSAPIPDDKQLADYSSIYVNVLYEVDIETLKGLSYAARYLVRCDLALEEVQQTWVSQDFVHAYEKYNFNMRYLIGKSSSELQTLLAKAATPPAWAIDDKYITTLACILPKPAVS